MATKGDKVMAEEGGGCSSQWMEWCGIAAASDGVAACCVGGLV